MTQTKIAINGFGRIGRNAFKIAFERSDLEIVAINDLTDNKTLAYLLKHDSNYGTYEHDVSSDDNGLIVDGKKIKVLSEKDPAALPWADLGRRARYRIDRIFYRQRRRKQAYHGWCETGGDLLARPRAMASIRLCSVQTTTR